ncbi:hypothetical protein [Scytonema sp. HK-05]|uniref:hypothetical protein n=1 Tax=Scytonema sp. HK-05 TaxID=1137095 RepID=UPI00116131D1|nr:hypothetical protein [Scytonema sp. HK-05]
MNKHSANHDPSVAQSTSYLGKNFDAWYHAFGRTEKERVELSTTYTVPKVSVGLQETVSLVDQL